MPKLTKNQSGMTLVELMIGFAIFAILLALSMSIMLFGTKVLSADSDQNRLKMVGDEMYSLLSDKLSFATHIQILPAGTDPETAKYDNIILIQDGKLLMGEKGGSYTSPYQSDIYLNTQLTLSATVESSYVLSLGLDFSRTESGEETSVYSTDSAIRMINLASRTDPVEIEGSGTTVNAVISYDSEPYSIEEGYESIPDAPYTVACYTENKKPVPLVDGTTYYPGDIVVIGNDNTGKVEYWQVVKQLTYDRNKPSMVPGHPHTQYWKSLDEEWKNESGKSVYEYHDVVSYGESYYGGSYHKNYFMFTDDWDDWVEVYWFPYHNDKDDRMLGWSLNPYNYIRIYTVYP